MKHICEVVLMAVASAVLLMGCLTTQAFKETSTSMAESTANAGTAIAGLEDVVATGGLLKTEAIVSKTREQAIVALESAAYGQGLADIRALKEAVKHVSTKKTIDVLFDGDLQADYDSIFNATGGTLRRLMLGRFQGSVVPLPSEFNFFRAYQLTVFKSPASLYQRVTAFVARPSNAYEFSEAEMEVIKSSLSALKKALNDAEDPKSGVTAVELQGRARDVRDAFKAATDHALNALIREWTTPGGGSVMGLYHDARYQNFISDAVEARIRSDYADYKDRAGYVKSGGALVNSRIQASLSRDEVLEVLNLLGNTLGLAAIAIAKDGDND